MAPIAAERSIRIIQHCAHPALAVQRRPAAASPDPGQPDLQRHQVQPPAAARSRSPARKRAPARPAIDGLRHRAGHLAREHRPHLRPLRAPRRRADRGRGHRDRAAAGQSPRRGHARPADRVERPRSGIGLHRQPPARPGHGPAPRSPARRHQRDRAGRTAARPEPASAFCTSRTTRRTSRWSPGSCRAGRTPRSVRDVRPGRPRLRRPGHARHHPARPAPARPARRPGTAASSRPSPPPPPSPWWSCPPTPPPASSTACSPAARSPTSPSPSNSPNSASCSTLLPPARPSTSRRSQLPRSSQPERPGRRAPSFGACQAYLP